MNIANIIERIESNTGIIRFKYELDNIDTGYNTFIQIANSILKWTGNQFNDELVKKEILILIDWLYMTGGNDLNYTKGILFKGMTGRGKTFLFKVFQEFVKIDAVKYIENGHTRPMKLEEINARKIAGEYQHPQDGGYKVIDRYSSIPCLLINDIGAEQAESLSFGNKVNVIDLILDRREELNKLTFATTNVQKFEDKEGYDDRTISRMRRLFNVVPIAHDTDFRKK